MPDCTTLGCPNPGTLTGVYDDGDERARVTYCTECATALAGEFTPDTPAAPDSPGDRDQQQAAEVLAKLPISIPGYRAETIKAAQDHLAAALAAARAEEAARWQAKIEALIDLYKRTGWMRRDVPADLRAVLDGEQ